MCQEFVIPGDEVDVDSSASSKQHIGPGLRADGEIVKCVKPGELIRRDKIVWVKGSQKRYIPVKGENVLGIVTVKGGDAVRVDIGGSSPAVLNLLAFEGVTKKNKPNLQVGDLVYGRLLEANKDMDPELVCIDSKGKSNGLGKLTDGFVISCSVDHCRMVLSEGNETLSQIAEFMSFEVAVGVNGRIWINASSVQNIVIVGNALKIAEGCRPDQLKKMLQKLLQPKK